MNTYLILILIPYGYGFLLLVMMMLLAKLYHSKVKVLTSEQYKSKTQEELRNLYPKGYVCEDLNIYEVKKFPRVLELLMILYYFPIILPTTMMSKDDTSLPAWALFLIANAIYAGILCLCYYLFNMIF